MSVDKVIECISCGRTSLGIEIGSTRIKSVLITDAHKPVATGSFEWESEYIDGNWTYSLDDVWRGIQESYRNLYEDV
ncbi:MAG TPA: ATPase, partial [Clostridia bacterium]|nr:ATPase [Clostridia bacterium]